MAVCCVVVADGARARFFALEEGGQPRAPHVLVEGEVLENPALRERGESMPGRPRTETNSVRNAGPVYPITAQRERHRVEHMRRYAGQIVDRAAGHLAGSTAGMLMLIAEPRLLSMMREAARHAVGARVRVKELARDFGGLSRSEIERRLEAERALD